MASRNRDAAYAAIEELHADTGKEAIYLHLDLMSLKSIRRAAEEYLRKETRLDVLINGGYVTLLENFLLAAHGIVLQCGDVYDRDAGTS